MDGEHWVRRWRSYLRGGHLKVHFGGSMKLPRHGSVCPIFRSRFFFRPASDAAGLSRPEFLSKIPNAYMCVNPRPGISRGTQ